MCHLTDTVHLLKHHYGNFHATQQIEGKQFWSCYPLWQQCEDIAIRNNTVK